MYYMYSTIAYVIAAWSFSKKGSSN